MVFSKYSTWQPGAIVFRRYAEAMVFRLARQPVLPIPEWISLVEFPPHCVLGYRSKDHWIPRFMKGNAMAMLTRKRVARRRVAKDIL